MDLSALSDFNLVAIHGGFGKASRASGRPKATLARRVTDLENSLGIRLIQRGSRSLRLTEEGQHLHERTVGLLGEITEVGESLHSGLAQPRGHLRVSAPVLFSHTVLGGLAAEFSRRYPDVMLEIHADDRFIDLVEDGYDVAIRVNPRPDDNLVGRCFARDEMLVVAHPAIMAALGNKPWDGQVVPAVAMTAMAMEQSWSLGVGDATSSVRPDVRLRLSSLLMVRDAVRAGAGAAALPRSILRDDLEAGRIEILGKLPERQVEFWALHHSRRLVSTKVATFVDFLCQSFPDREL